MTTVRWNVSKKHRCPECHAVAVSSERPHSWRIYTCCRCATRFTRWPRLSRLMPEAGIRCGEHTTVRDGVLDEALAVIADPGYRANGVGWESARDAEVLTETAADLKAHCLVHNRFAATGFMDCPCRVADELLRKAKETRREPERPPCTCRRLPMPAGQTCNAHQTKETRHDA